MGWGACAGPLKRHGAGTGKKHAVVLRVLHHNIKYYSTYYTLVTIPIWKRLNILGFLRFDGWSIDHGLLYMVHRLWSMVYVPSSM
jgi:hypothetical protein